MIQDEPELITPVNLLDNKPLSVSAYPNIKSVVRLFFVFVFYSIILGISFGIALLILDGLQIKSKLITSFFNLLAYVTSQLLLIRYAIKKSKKQSPNQFKIDFNKVKGWFIPIFIITTVALVVLLDKASSWIPMPISVQKFFERMFTKDIFTIIVLTIAAPILEEILARGIVLKGLLKNYSPHKAILISAIFFSALHLNPWQAMPAFMGGLFLGWIYYKTQSVIPGIIVHATINSLAALLIFMPSHPKSIFELLGPQYYIMTYILAIVTFCAGCYVINNNKIAKTNEVNANLN